MKEEKRIRGTLTVDDKFEVLATISVEIHIKKKKQPRNKINTKNLPPFQ